MPMVPTSAFLLFTFKVLNIYAEVRLLRLVYIATRFGRISMKLHDAIAYGDIQQLEKWRDAGVLPDLMAAPDMGRTSWYPHEVAVRYGQLETLKWLVNNSGQEIDLTIEKSRSLFTASAYGHTEVLLWLLLESQQAVDLGLVIEDDDWFVSAVYSEDVRLLLESIHKLARSNISIETIRAFPEMIDAVKAPVSANVAPKRRL